MRKIILLSAAYLSLASMGKAQSLYEDFNYTISGNIGGNTSSSGTNNNNWYTHSNSQAGTISVLSGSLNYTGLVASSGNRVFIPGANGTVSRDVNRPAGLPASQNTTYASFYLNVIDVTQLGSSYSSNSYFFHLSATNGNSAGNFFARIGIKSVNSNANFRLGIADYGNTFTDFATDLNFGTTYLVVIKYVYNSGGTDVASIWVNPSSLGGSEPSGSISNSSSSGNIGSYNSTNTGICIRNAGSTPKAEIDEIRVGTIWADVTPTPPLYYRSITSGNWNANATWESSTDAAFTTPVNPAVAAPDFNANAVTIRNGHTVTATADITTDQTTIENGGIVNIAPSIALSLNDGTGTDLTVATGGGLVFQSSNVGTARITNVGTATISSDNNVTVERYLNDRRAWRLINTPLTATANTTVVTNWQNNFGAGSGVGTNITGPTGTNGADFTSVSYSLKTFNSATQVLDNVTNISTANQFANPYFIFVRGDKTITTPTGHSATTLRAVGNLITGDQTTTVSQGGTPTYMLVGNPYASPVNFAGFTRSNVSNGFYIWDASLGTLGLYVYVDGTSSFQTTPAASTQTQHIQSGQSFFVIASAGAGNSSVTIHEADKSTTNTPAVFRTTSSDEELALTLSSVNANTLTTVDGLRLKRNANYTNAIDASDITKMSNVNENLAIVNSAGNYVIERKAPLTNTNDTVALKFWNTALKDYRISIDLSNISSAKAVYLLDAYTATTTALNLNGTTDYDFTVTNAAGSWDANRFKIVYEAKTALSIPTSQTSKGTIAVYPNPAKAGNTTLSMNGFAKGRYAITLYNVAGQQVMTTSIVHDGNNNAHVINLAGVATGTYQLQVANEATGSTTQKIIVQP